MTRMVTILDGAMGTMLMRAGLEPGKRPELLSLTAPDVVGRVNGAYVRAGAGMILANTFGANARKLEGTGRSPEEVIAASVSIALRAAEGSGAAVALDIGPIGELMEPLGGMSFETAYELYAQMIRAGALAGAQAVFFETFSDLNELRAGVLAARECCALPVFACMTFEKTGHTFLGCRADAAAMALTGLGVSAVGLNCSLGPEEAAPILRTMRTATHLPLIFKPNAGKPDPRNGRYAVEPAAFADACAPLLDIGAAYIGGCCGTTPDFTRELARRFGGGQAVWQEEAVRGVCSASAVTAFGKGICVVGERINPTGNARVKRALTEGDMEDIARIAVEQEAAGAQILDVNVGLPGLDEAEAMRRAVTAISAAATLPLQIDSSNPAAIEAGLRAAPGKCIVNSVNASRASLETVLPLAQKYGAAIIALTVGESGLPENAGERMLLAGRILAAARSAGIERHDVIVDCLTLTVSAQQDQTGETLEAVRRVSR
ncbi:MAG: homocysteine S-methyltransferase family protein, partial [Clostridia bacterium]|nr:homocysteine S-methyltransferase family protein [Clostridia bacterium]